MTSPVTREPVDVALLIKEWLKEDFAGLHDGVPERFPGSDLLVRLELPAEWSVWSGPVLVVADDGGPLNHWPTATSPTIRVTSWTSGRETKYAYWALARLLTARIPGVAAVLPGAGVLEARDSKTGGDLTSFTVLTRVRTKPVLSATAALTGGGALSATVTQ